MCSLWSLEWETKGRRRVVVQGVLSDPFRCLGALSLDCSWVKLPSAMSREARQLLGDGPGGVSHGGRVIPSPSRCSLTLKGAMSRGLRM